MHVQAFSPPQRPARSAASPSCSYDATIRHGSWSCSNNSMARRSQRGVSSQQPRRPVRCVAHATQQEEESGASGSSSGSSSSSSSSEGSIPNVGVLSPRRFLLSGLVSTAVVLGGNLGGLTSFLLGTDGGRTARDLQLDAIFPVNALPTPYKRAIDGTFGYEFTYPAQWLADQTVAYRAAQRAEDARGLGMMGDLPPAARSDASLQRARAEQRRKAAAFEPVAAYGPPGSTGEENISVIVAPIYEGFSLDAMGTPDLVAQQFIQMIAPSGGKVQAELLGASSREEEGQLYYTMEFRVKRESNGQSFFRHNISVIASRANQLYTLNAQVAESKWGAEAPLLRAAADSFRLRSSSKGTLDTTGFPQRI